MCCSWRRAARNGALFLLLLALFSCGCGGAKQKLLDDSQHAVETALDAWQRGDKPDSLLAGTEAIEFFDDDWNRSVTLVEYTIHQTYFETDGTPRCAVDLVLKHGTRQPEQVRVTYEMVNKEDRLVIARDPMS